MENGNGEIDHERSVDEDNDVNGDAELNGVTKPIVSERRTYKYQDPPNVFRDVDVSRSRFPHLKYHMTD